MEFVKISNEKQLTACPQPMLAITAIVPKGLRIKDSMPFQKHRCAIRFSSCHSLASCYQSRNYSIFNWQNSHCLMVWGWLMFLVATANSKLLPVFSSFKYVKEQFSLPTFLLVGVASAAYCWSASAITKQPSPKF